MAARSYTGEQVTSHVIQPGQTLSGIAQDYGFPSWEPLYRYNTSVRPILDEDPDHIPSGIEIFVPRSRKGYESLIKKLKRLRLDIELTGIRETGTLERAQWEYKATVEMFDFAGDVALTLATFGLQSVRAAKAAQVAETTVGRGRVAAQYLADREAEKLSKALRKKLESTVTGAAAKTMDRAHERYTGRATSVGATTHKTLSTGQKVLEAARGYSLKGGKSFLDVADIVLDYVSPSGVANAYLWLSTGETPEQTFKSQQRQVAETVRTSLERLNLKIRKYERELEIVHDGRPVRIIEMPPLVISV